MSLTILDKAKEKMKNIVGFITIFVFAVALVAAYILVDKMLFNNAVDKCFETGRTAFEKEDGSTANTPDNYWFEICMEEKGYK